MSHKPSWLDDEENQAKVGETAAKVASSPAVQKSFMDNFTPSWAKAAPAEPAQARPVEAVAAPAATPASSSATGEEEPKEFVGDPEEIRKMNTWKYILSFFYIAAAVNLGAAAGMSLIGQTDISKGFFAVYVLFFSVVICCFEIAFGELARIMAINFGFLYSTVGRCVFVIFVGIMSFDEGGIYPLLAMCILYLAYVVHIVTRFRFPRFEEFIRKKHYFKSK